MATKKAKRPAPREKHLMIRASATELDLFRSAAEFAGNDLSGWVRDRLLSVARAELQRKTA